VICWRIHFGVPTFKRSNGSAGIIGKREGCGQHDGQSAALLNEAAPSARQLPADHGYGRDGFHAGLERILIAPRTKVPGGRAGNWKQAAYQEHHKDFSSSPPSIECRGSVGLPRAQNGPPRPSLGHQT
jgi:hypothetical protein